MGAVHTITVQHRHSERVHKRIAMEVMEFEQAVHIITTYIDNTNDKIVN